MKDINIYALINPVNDNVFYVGATYQDLNKRLSTHISHISRTPNNKKSIEIKELIENAQKPEILLLDKVEFDQASFYEQYYIDLFKSFGYTLHQRNISAYSKMFSGKDLGKHLQNVHVPITVTLKQYKMLQVMAKKKDWSVKRLVENIILDFLDKVKKKPSRLNDL